MKVGLYGGSFNPVHNGHLEIAKRLIDEKVVDEVWFIPCKDHPFDKKLLPWKERAKMLSIVIGRFPFFRLDRTELDSTGKSYTARTVAALKKKFNHDFYFVLGGDNLADLKKWHDFDYLKKNVKFIVAMRRGYRIPSDIGVKVGSFLQTDDPVSSTIVRDNIKKGNDIKKLVPLGVERYIKQENLYMN